MSKHKALILLVPLLLLTPVIAHAHGGEDHNSKGVSVASSSNTDDTSPSSIPTELKDIGGTFSLTDHNGQPVTEKTFAGKYTLVFFGYVDCQIMCSISLGRIGDALTLLQKKDVALLDKVTPLIVTVDPENDTPDKMRSALQKYHPSLIGLTGQKKDLEQMYDAYDQNPRSLEESLNGVNVVSHSSYFYLMGPDGKFRTLFPPILNPESMASIIEKYVDAG